MASNINPANINGAYPIAGQDNDSQGFRDNFINIKSNLTFAQAEITALQTSTVTIGAENDLAITTLKNPKLWNATEKVYHHAAAVTTAVIDYSAGDYQDMDVQGDISFTFQNWPASGNYAKLRVLFTELLVTEDITFPAEVTLGLDGIAGFAGQVFTPPAAGDYLFEFSTDNAGAVVAVNLLIAPGGEVSAADIAMQGNITSLQSSVTGLTSNVWIGPTQTLTSPGTANVSVTSSSISVTGPSTATLAAGSREGQVHEFMMLANSGPTHNYSITVTNPGWGGTGNITLNAVGQACTLRYVSSKWFVTGNNGATIS